MNKLLAGLRDPIPVAAFAGLMARGTSFSIGLGVTAGFGAERAVVALEGGAVRKFFLGSEVGYLQGQQEWQGEVS
jgi:hypothetical protein